MVFNPWWTKMTWNPSVFFQLVLEKNGLGLEVDILENYGIGSETDVSLVDQDDLNWSSSTLMVFNPWDSKLFKSSWSIKDTSVSLPIPPRPSTTSVFVTIVLTSKWTGVSLKGCRLPETCVPINYSNLSSKSATLCGSSDICNKWITYVTLMVRP
jgi:hypothetical protein